MTVEILGVQIDDLSESDVLQKVSAELKAGRRIFIATPNPEMIVLAQKNGEFLRILNSANIKIADGVGLKFGAAILGRRLKNRMTGTDLTERLCELAAAENLGVYFLGAGRGVAIDAAKKLQNKYGELKICGAEEGGQMDDWDSGQILSHINEKNPAFLFVALGHGRQEKWLAENLDKMPGVKLAMGVGGAFDFFADRASRAPMILRRIGLEWLWRLITEPKRYKRIFSAVIIFPSLCIKKSAICRGLRG
jgi:N-acetylglucosaminyldiphosphoundecaprenol N-acetyl-beta-D-mannosaminyltransferase